MVQLIHANAVNVARRLTAQNEPDLLQEDFFAEPEEPTFKKESKHGYSHDFCQKLSKHLLHAKRLPPQCNKYKDVVDSLKRRETDMTHKSAELS